MSHDLPITQFGLDAADMDSCAIEVLQGNKRATTSLLAAYSHDNEALPTVGQRSMVRDSRARDIAIIEVTRVEFRRYSAVDAVFAKIEGEGDKSLAHWQRVHWSYLDQECTRIGVPLNEEVELVLEYFKVVQSCLPLAQF